MPLGWTLARIAGSDDPGTMLTAAGIGWWTAALVALATVTTNFANIYLSSLAWGTLSPQSTSSGLGLDHRLDRHRARPVVVGVARSFCGADGAARLGAGPGRRRLPRPLRCSCEGPWISRPSITTSAAAFNAAASPRGRPASSSTSWPRRSARRSRRLAPQFIVYALRQLSRSISFSILLHRIHTNETSVKPVSSYAPSS